MRGTDLDLDVFRIDRESKPVGPTELRQFQIVAAPVIEKTLSAWNNMQTDQSVR
jgi:hypothetical protein